MDNWRAGRIPPGETQTLWGQPVEQVMTALCAFDRLFAAFQPKRIVEWGTGSGGFSAYLAVWAKLLRAELMTIDERNIHGAQDFLARLDGLPLRFRKADFMADPWLCLASWTIPKAPSLILCDGGTDKGEQLLVVAEYARAGDVVAVHDYVPIGDGCGKANQVSPAAVDSACLHSGLAPHMQDMFDAWHSHWLCLRKEV